MVSNPLIVVLYRLNVGSTIRTAPYCFASFGEMIMDGLLPVNCFLVDALIASTALKIGAELVPCILLLAVFFYE